MRRESTCAEWLLRSGLVAALLVGVVAVPVQGIDSCHIVRCDKDCVPSSPTYQPQRCGNCCPSVGATGSNNDDRSIANRLETVESAVSELRVMTGVLLALVMVLLLVVVALLLQLTKNCPKKFELPVFFRSKKDSSSNAHEKNPQKNCNGVAGNSTTVSRLANHQSNSSSPHARRSSLSRTSLGNTDLEPQPRPFRVRQPSESTCPEEGDSITQGYDNLGLSTSTINTSTLHNTSNSSTDTLGPALSTNTLHTTLPSENHLDSNNAQNNTRV